MNPDFNQMLENELDLIQKLNSKHIVQFIDVQHTNSNYYFVFELCPMGDLLSFIRSQEKDRLDEFEAQRLFRQLALALKVLY